MLAGLAELAELAGLAGLAALAGSGSREIFAYGILLKVHRSGEVPVF
jgi:hypothetical protein